MVDGNLITSIAEENKNYSDESLYNITSFGTDLTYRELVQMYADGDLEKPELQRKYVWSKREASRFIDSILLGLPVPSIFLAKTKDEKRLIVDGYQRIMTVYDYIQGIFSGDGKVFKLSNTEDINKEWRGKAFSELKDEYKRRIRTSPIHAIIFEQKSPKDDTGMYQIFERINTGGKTLKPQEIRNCVYHGKFNKLLMDLNKEKYWRDVLGSNTEDSRMSDIELILRFFAFSNIINRKEMEQKQINLSKYLNVYMGENNNPSEDEIEQKHSDFKMVITYLLDNIGEHVFRTYNRKDGEIRWAKKVNPVVFDSVTAATYKMLTTLGLDNFKGEGLFDRYIQLLEDEEYDQSTRFRTTNTENIKKRINKALYILYGIKDGH
ncbi:DUF262 domain-containing protein [Streptococcus parauberis]|uniref:DUF262 domain-containing protein n=1 Tax=Streptococcus parauberis TaxID=1348 RepID=UPI000E307604|nr:DUF262 domain-containing protein [Streptococcus parauberis]RFE01062.1 hypothetical protein ADO06_01935 [Streptococcus parauberis]